jgi:hypothetical protein
MPPMGDHRKSRLAIFFVIGALLYAECVYLARIGFEQGDWRPIVGSMVTSLMTTVVLAFAVSRP